MSLSPLVYWTLMQRSLLSPCYPEFFKFLIPTPRQILRKLLWSLYSIFYMTNDFRISEYLLSVIVYKRDSTHNTALPELIFVWATTRWLLVLYRFFLILLNCIQFLKFSDYNMDFEIVFAFKSIVNNYYEGKYNIFLFYLNILNYMVYFYSKFLNL
ncbi:hypothetical protein ACJX0J_040507, partial [Zea mays]